MMHARVLVPLLGLSALAGCASTQSTASDWERIERAYRAAVATPHAQNATERITDRWQRERRMARLAAECDRLLGAGAETDAVRLTAETAAAAAPDDAALRALRDAAAHKDTAGVRAGFARLSGSRI